MSEQASASAEEGGGETARILGAVVAPYAVAAAVLGLLLASRKLAYVWAPIPNWVPARDAIACVAGGSMAVAALGLLWRRTLVPSAVATSLLFLAWLLALQIPRTAAMPATEALWAGCAQIVTATTGGWVVFASVATPGVGARRWLRGRGAVRIARALYAVALPVFGFHHFVDPAGSAEAVPAWLPFRLGWGYLTGAAHVAAGLAILLGALVGTKPLARHSRIASVVAALAAKLEALMIAAFVVLVHVPGVLGAPSDTLQWTMLVVASVIGGASWIVACSYAQDERS